MVENVVYLIRHGESVANTQGIYQGQTYDTKLSALGEKQVNALGVFLAQKPIDRIIASPLKRTRDTAEAIAKWHDGLTVEIDPDIIETNHGAWEGKNVHVVAKLWPEEYSIWQTQPSKAVFPQGETYAETRIRALKWWKELLPTIRGTTAVVTHDNIVRALLTDMLGMQQDLLWNMELQPAAITKLKITGATVKVSEVNNTNHLEGLQANLANHAL